MSLPTDWRGEVLVECTNDGASGQSPRDAEASTAPRMKVATELFLVDGKGDIESRGADRP
jgi:hypothetical protein